MTGMRRHGTRQPAADAARVLVVGAGFGGVATLSTLARAGLQVMLVDRNAYSTFQPLLYQVATAGLTPSDVAYPARGFRRKYRCRFRRGELSGIDAVRRRVALADGGQLDYDYLILATGVAAAYYGVTGAAEHACGLYTRRDAITLRDQLMACLERLSIAGPGKDVTVTVVGGGATGVELAGTLAEVRNIAFAAAYPDIDPGRVKVRLVEQAHDLLAPFHPSLRRYARRQLLARGIDVRLDAAIREITADRVLLTDGEDLPSDLTVWAAGVTAPPAASHWGLPQGRGGRIMVDPDLRVSGQDRIFAVGDIALISGQQLPQLAQPALQMGRHAAEQIRRIEDGQPAAAFCYHDKGIMATIGRRSAVVQLAGGVRIRGTLAWFAWLALHLVTLLGNRNRISALLNLSWRYLTWARGGGLIIGEDPPEPSPPT